MKLLKHKLAIVFLVITTVCIAQDKRVYEDYEWNNSPTYTNDSTKDVKSLKHAVITEFYFEGESALTEYLLEHKVLCLNSDEAIEGHNKVYITYTQSSEVVISKARVISKNGDVKVLDDSKVLTALDEETGSQYTYFAFEGIEKGSIIEYYYVLKKAPSYKGKRMIFQTSYDKENTSFDLYAPKNLQFKFKSYNDIPEVEQDTTLKEKLHWQLLIDKIDALDEETFSAYKASKASVIYKLGKNLANNKTGFASYSSITKNLYAFYYPEYTKKELKSLNKFLSEIKLDSKLNNDEATLRKLDNVLKTNIFISKSNEDQLKDLETILTNKIASRSGIIKLYVALLRTLNIKHEFVFTSDRQNLKFDKDFEAQNFLTDVLLYFPKFKTYTSPEEGSSRYGFPPAYLTDNYGLFIREVALGNITSGLGKVKYIKAVEANKTTDEMFIDVTFSKDDLSKTIVNIKRSMTGYYAMYVQPYIGLANKEDIDEFVDAFAKNLDENADINTKDIKNGDAQSFGVSPLIVDIDFDSDAFVEKAGRKYLFKVGNLIGQQMEMYQEKERILPIEGEFNRRYLRTITINIPEGYRIVNLEDININNKYLNKDNNEIVSFNSNSTLEGNVLKIKADEYYRQNKIDRSLYEEFRNVINSAADFNKITLILEPIN